MNKQKYKEILEYSSTTNGYEDVKKTQKDHFYNSDNSSFLSYADHYDKGCSNRLKNNNYSFEEWIVFLETKASDAFRYKSEKRDTLFCIREIEESFTKKTNDSRFNYLSEITNQVESLNTDVSLASLFNSIKFTHEIPVKYLSQSCYFVDRDSLNVNMSLVSDSYRLDITFKDNGEVTFSYVDRENGRIRINGSSFFGVGRNRNETKKIIKLFKLSSR